MMETAHHYVQMIVQLIAPLFVQNTVPLMIIATYIFLNVGLYFHTRGKEFAIAGYSGALFLIPFLKFG
jgi:hypothetical protein